MPHLRPVCWHYPGCKADEGYRFFMPGLCSGKNQNAGRWSGGRLFEGDNEMLKIIIPGTPIAKNVQNSKYCHSCKKVKNVDEFYSNKSKKDGIHTECKECHTIACKKYRQTDKYKKAASKSYYKNKEKNANRRSDYYLKNKEKIIGKQASQREERIKWFFGKIGGFCRNCGYKKSTTALQLHHLDSNQKNGVHDVLSNWIKWTSLNRFISKINSLSFTILCSNCHSELHAGLIDKKFNPIGELKND